MKTDRNQPACIQRWFPLSRKNHQLGFTIDIIKEKVTENTEKLLEFSYTKINEGTFIWASC